jgi:thioredoxin 1
MLNFIVLIVIVILINKFLTKQASSSPYSKNPNPNSNINSNSNLNSNSNNSKMVKVIESADEFKSVIASSNLVVVDFFAVWCGPCKMIAPLLEKFNNDYSNVDFFKVDVDQLPSVAQENDVSSMPTLLFFKNSQLVGKVVGANPGAIKQTIDKLV